METASAKYHANNAHECDLAVVERQIHTRDIGLAFPENLPEKVKKPILEELHNVNILVYFLLINYVLFDQPNRNI